MTENPETLAVLALDAADYDLIERWKCKNLQLENHAELETFSYSLDGPYTPEVWASAATGVTPDIHGVGESTYTWDNPVLRAGSKITQLLPHYYRRKLGTIVAGGRTEKAGKMSFQMTDHDHVFHDGLIKGWPGISPAENLSAAWNDIGAADEGEITDREFRNRIVTRTGEELGWLSAASEYTDAPIAGVHSHILDAAGHAYGENEVSLRKMYRAVDRMVGELREQVDRLVILSDHGMEVSFLNDDNPGTHSWRAFISSTEPEPLPESVLAVREWLEAQKPAAAESGELASVDTPTEHLKNLGYVE